LKSEGKEKKRVKGIVKTLAHDLNLAQTFPLHEHAEFKSTDNQITQSLDGFPDCPPFPTLICIFSTTGAVQS